LGGCNPVLRYGQSGYGVLGLGGSAVDPGKGNGGGNRNTMLNSGLNGRILAFSGDP